MSKPSKPDRHSERKPAPAPAAAADNAVWDALSGRKGSRWARGPGRRGAPPGYVGGDDQVRASEVTFDSQEAARVRAQTRRHETAQHEQQALVVELGVFFDLFIAVMVVGILVFRIRATFATTDVNQLNRLKG